MWGRPRGEAWRAVFALGVGGQSLERCLEPRVDHVLGAARELVGRPGRQVAHLTQRCLDRSHRSDLEGEARHRLEAGELVQPFEQAGLLVAQPGEPGGAVGDQRQAAVAEAAHVEVLGHFRGELVTQVLLGALDQSRHAHQRAELAVTVEQTGHGLGAEALSLYTHGLVSRGLVPVRRTESRTHSSLCRALMPASLARSGVHRQHARPHPA